MLLAVLALLLLGVDPSESGPMIFRVLLMPAKVQMDSTLVEFVQKQSGRGSSRDSRSSSNGGPTVSVAWLKYIESRAQQFHAP
jgi:hypothetical protein